MVCVVEQGLGSGVTTTTNVPLPTLHPWRPRHPHTRGHSLPPATPLPTPRPLHHRVYFLTASHRAPPTVFFSPKFGRQRAATALPRHCVAHVPLLFELRSVAWLLCFWGVGHVFDVVSVASRSLAGDILSGFDGQKGDEIFHQVFHHSMLCHFLQFTLVL